MCCPMCTDYEYIYIISSASVVCAWFDVKNGHTTHGQRNSHAESLSKRQKFGTCKQQHVRVTWKGCVSVYCIGAALRARVFTHHASNERFYDPKTAKNGAPEGLGARGEEQKRSVRAGIVHSRSVDRLVALGGRYITPSSHPPLEATTQNHTQNTRPSDRTTNTSHTCQNVTPIATGMF